MGVRIESFQNSYHLIMYRPSLPSEVPSTSSGLISASVRKTGSLGIWILNQSSAVSNTDRPTAILGKLWTNEVGRRLFKQPQEASSRTEASQWIAPPARPWGRRGNQRS